MVGTHCSVEVMRVMAVSEVRWVTGVVGRWVVILDDWEWRVYVVVVGVTEICRTHLSSGEWHVAVYCGAPMFVRLQDNADTCGIGRS